MAIPSGSPTIALSPGQGTILYLDTAGNVQPNLLATYRAYKVTNAGSTPIADAWVKVDGFTGSYVGLASQETGLAHIGPLAAGASQTVFFYLGVNCSSFSAGNCNVSTAQNFAVGLYSGPPSTTALATLADFLTVQETTSASANKVTSVTTSAANPSLGSLITVTVVGSTGTMSSNPMFSLNPQTYYTFPANAFRLTRTSITLSGSNSGTYVDQLNLSPAFTSDTPYTVTYTYLVNGLTTTTTPVSPIAYITSGGQMKHTGTGSFATLPAMGVTSNTLSAALSVSDALLPSGGTARYTTRVTNSGNFPVTLDDFVAGLPSTPDTATYIPGSATLDGSTISDPDISGNTAKWTAVFTVPANGSIELSFDVSIPNTAGTYHSSIVPHVGTTPIGTTLDTSSASASADVSVGTPDLAVEVSHTGDFSQGQNGAAYTILVSNIGTGPTSRSVSVEDMLPSGLTATAMSGSGWTCNSSTVTCSRSDVLATASSYPSIALTVNVASSGMPGSVTNIATVWNTDDSNSSNNTASDLTTIGSSVTATSTTLVATPTTVNYGGSVSLTATVSPTPGGSSRGTVSFYNGSALLGSGTVDSAGVAAISSSALPVGTDSLTAVYSGNSGFGASTSVPAPVTVNLASSTTAVSASPATVSYGTTVALSATVTPTPAGGTLGSVAFYDGSTLLGTHPVNSGGIATASPATFTVGLHPITAIYSGNDTLASSTSAATSVTVNQASTAIALVASPTTGEVGGSVTLTASVSPSPSGGSSGIVSFFNDATLLGTAQVTAGIATLSTPALPAGNDSVTAVYGGNTELSGSTSPAVLVTVHTASSSTVVSASAASIVYGSPITLTAAVSPAPTGSTPGTVVFYTGTAVLGTAPVNSAGNAALTTSVLPIGTDAVTARYSGNTALSGSTSPAITVMVQSGTVTVQVSVTSSRGVTPQYGDAVTFAPSLQGDAAGTATGTITYSLNQAAFGSEAVTAGTVAARNATELAAGSYTLGVSYSGDATHAAASTSTTFTIAPAPLSATSADASRVFGAPNPNFTGSLSGLVNGDVLSETFSTTATIASAPGTYSIVPSVTGSQLHNYAVAVAAGKLSILPATPTITVSRPADSFLGDRVSLAATVVSPTSGVPSGTVTFLDGTISLGTVTLDNSGTATLSTSSLGSGAHSFSAVYNGDGNFITATSAAVSATVNTAYSIQAPPDPFQLAPGGSIAVNVSLGPLGGAFNNIVVLSATGLPAGVTATFAPATVVPAATGASTVMTLHYNAAQAEMQSQDRPASKAPLGIFAAGALCLCFGRKRLSRIVMLMLVTGVATGSLFTLTGCGGGWANFSNASAQRIVVTVIGTSGTLQRSTTVTVDLR